MAAIITIPGEDGEPEEVISDRCQDCYVGVPVQYDAGDSDWHQPTQEQVFQMMDELGINVRRHGHIGINEMEPAPVRKELASFLEGVVKAGPWTEANTLYLWGPTGTGKSQAAVAVVGELLRRGMPRRRIIYDRGRAMITQLQDRYKTGHVDEFSEVRRKCGLWVYEDAGTEKVTPDAFRVLEDVLDAREGKPTIITTNQSRHFFAERWRQIDGWERLQSRLGPYRAIEFKGVDRRLG